MNVPQQEFEDIICFAFRYVLGRKTYAVKLVTDALIKYKDNISDLRKVQIIEEISQAMIESRIGDDYIDRPEWEKVIQHYTRAIENE